MCLAFIVAPAAAGAACTISWDGQLGDDWFAFQANGPGTADDVYNWSPERYPDGNDDVCFPTGAVASTDQVTQNTPTVRSFTISAGATLSVTEVQFIVAENSINAGTLNMSGPVPVTISDGNVGDAEGLTNTGTIHFTAGGGAGLRSLHGDLLNQGTIDVDHPEASIQEPGAGGPADTTQTNQGTIDISAGNALRVLSSTFVHGTGSVISGGGTMDVSQSRIEVSGNSQIAAGTDVNLRVSTIAGTAGASTGNIDAAGGLLQGGGPSTLEGILPAGITLDLDSTVVIVPPVTTTVNAGRININGNAAQLKVEPNDTGPNSTSRLTNQGTIEFTAGGTSGLRLITGDVVNQGTLLVNHPEASFQFPGGSTSVPMLTNQGPLTVSSANVLRVLGATLINDSGGLIGGNGTINNEQAVNNSGGIVAPGSSPGVLTITGDYLQGPGGTLEVEISGAAPGTGHDQLVVGGTATLGGTVSVDTSGFSPAAGQQFKIIDAPAPPATSISGTFATLVPTGGRTYGVAYNPNDVTLTAAALTPPPTPPPTPPGGDSDGDGVLDAFDNCPTQAGPASNGGCPVTTSPPPVDDGACDTARDKLAAAKKQLRKLVKQETNKAKTKRPKAKVKKAKAKIKRAKARVRKGKAKVKKVCA